MWAFTLSGCTLLSGEGHTGKKVGGALLAVTATIAGAGGGQDFASREPVEEHFLPDDARKIALEVGQMLESQLKVGDATLIGPDAVAALPAYAELEGETEIDIKKEYVKGKMFQPDYYFGIMHRAIRQVEVPGAGKANLHERQRSFRPWCAVN